MQQSVAPKDRIIKKYGNRRLYDTGESRYITLDELAEIVRGGADVRVVDAKSGSDLTQATLTQIIIEGRNLARLLPVSLLTQLIRLGDDNLAEFFSRYVTSAMEMYLQAKRGAQAIAPYNPFAQLPFSATDALARLFMQGPLSPAQPQPGPVGTSEEPDLEAPEEAPEVRATRDDVAALRRELEELKRSMRSEEPETGSDERRATPRRRRRR